MRARCTERQTKNLRFRIFIQKQIGKNESKKIVFQKIVVQKVTKKTKRITFKNAKEDKLTLLQRSQLTVQFSASNTEPLGRASSIVPSHSKSLPGLTQPLFKDGL